MIRQLSVFVENKPGGFHQVTMALRKKEIALYAFCSVDSPEFGILRVICDKTDEAQKLLTELGYMVKVYDVIAVETAGVETVDEMLAACHESNISINYMYSSYGSEKCSAATIFYSEYLDETESMLTARGFCCLDTLDRGKC